MVSILHPGLCLAISLLAQTPQPSRDAAPTTTAAVGGVVRGRVTAAAADQPLHRVRVTLNGGSAQNPPSGVTDMRGAFEIPDVPPGTYTVSFARAGYLTTLYGQKRPREAGRPLIVTPGATVDKVDVAMQRGGVLAGRVFDDAGDPFAGVRVEAVELRYLRGRRVLVPARIGFTNDTGEFRLSGLDPGIYQLRASSRDAWEADDGKSTLVFATTMFPGVTSSEQAQNLTVRAGQELGGLDVRMIAGREARVTGVVQDATGAPLAGQAVHLSEITRTVGGAVLSSGGAGDTKTNERGEFRFDKIVPGEYLVIAGGPNDTTSATVVLNAGDVRHVVIMPATAAAVAGSVVADDGSRLPFAAARIAVDPVDANPDIVFTPAGASRPQAPRPDWTFRFANLTGEYLFRVNGLPDEWRLKAVMRGGRDITDAPLSLPRGAANVEGLQVIVTKQVAKVDGTVTDRAGAASADATVVLFAENRAQWGLGSRFVKVSRPDSDGRFTIGGLAPGVYRILARDVVLDGQWEDAEFLQSLMREATRIELKEGATESVTLTVMEAR